MEQLKVKKKIVVEKFIYNNEVGIRCWISRTFTTNGGKIPNSKIRPVTKKSIWSNTSNVQDLSEAGDPSKKDNACETWERDDKGNHEQIQRKRLVIT